MLGLLDPAALEKLPAGAYRLTATARDAAGNTSKAVKATFTVVA